MQYKILIAEDDEDIRELLTLYLENEGYRVITAENGVEALSAAESERPDLALVDIMMPKMNGYELTRHLRAGSMGSIPIIIISAMTADSDKIIGLDIGADDYITKPFNPLEVTARVRSNLRRFYKLDRAGDTDEKPETLTVGELTLDLKRIVLTKNGVEVPLTPTEFKILSLLMEKPGRVFTKVQLYERVCGDEFFESDNNTMMVHISKLREKIGDDGKNPKYLKTIRGLGYKIEKI
ncbi:MAG: response regulator transcription factor [Ruminococcus sp.]|nr:response regulator transcription factor [Ruminococcus sp.]